MTAHMGALCQEAARRWLGALTAYFPSMSSLGQVLPDLPSHLTRIVRKPPSTRNFSAAAELARPVLPEGRLSARAGSL